MDISRAMKLRKVISRRIDQDREGLSVRAAIDAAVAVNVNEPEGKAETPQPKANEQEEAPHE